MKIEVLAKNMEVEARVRTLVEKRLIPKIDKFLESVPEDEKLATIRFEKRRRWGYKASFSMRLPEEEPIYAESVAERLLSVIVDLREQVLRQVKQYRGQ